MKEETCRSCGSTLLEEGNFCGDCGQQARCQSCHNALRPNKRACIMCGAMVGAQGRPAIGTPLDHPLPPGMNSLEYREGKNTKSLRTVFTDNVANSLVAPLSAALAGRVIDPPRLTKTAATTSNHDIIDYNVPAALDSNLLEEGEIRDTTPTPEHAHSEEGIDGNSSLRKIFRYEGELIKPFDTRFKGNTKIDNVKRLTFLFLYAHDLEGRPHVPRSAVTSALREANLLDSNSRSWITTSPDLIRENGTIALRPSGREQISRIMADIENPEIEGISQPGSTVRRRTKKAAALPEKL